MAKRSKKNTIQPQQCGKCGLVHDNWVMQLTRIEPEEHQILCDPCYLAEFAKPIREYGVET